MVKRTGIRLELFVTSVVWIFLTVSAGVFLGLKEITERRSNTSVGETTEEIVLEEDEKDEPNSNSLETEEKEAPEAEEVAQTSTEIQASPFAGTAQNANGTNSSTTYNAIGHVGADGLKYIYYKTMVWGAVVADFSDFKTKVAETLNDARGWSRMGLRFVEVSDGQDLNIILSDAASLEGYNGYCSGELSCTSGFNEVIINDIRWREGTSETVAGGMSERDYQHMVINHEMGHWLGHYSHIEVCDIDGGVAPIMLQQSTGLRNCGVFNPWPLDFELWTLR